MTIGDGSYTILYCYKFHSIWYAQLFRYQTAQECRKAVEGLEDFCENLMSKNELNNYELLVPEYIKREWLNEDH